MNACSTGTVLIDHELNKILGSCADLSCILCEKERLQDYASLKIHLERVHAAYSVVFETDGVQSKLAMLSQQTQDILGISSKGPTYPKSQRDSCWMYFGYLARIVLHRISMGML